MQYHLSHSSWELGEHLGGAQSCLTLCDSMDHTVHGILQARILEGFPRASQVALVVKNLPASAGDVRDVCSIPGLGRSPGGGNGNPF